MDLEEYGIFIDTEGKIDENDDEKEESEEDEDTSDTIIKRVLKEYREEKLKEKQSAVKSEKPKSVFEQFFEEMGWHGPSEAVEKERKLSRKRKCKELIKPREDLVENKQLVEEVLHKSKVLKPDFSQSHSVPAYDLSERIGKRERKKEREKTKGKGWYNLPATEVTDEVKKDLEILRMRSVLDPKHFYKKNDVKVIPKYFQIGTVQDSHLEYHNRLTKKERKKTLVDELMSNVEFERYNKKKYAEIMSEKQKTHYSAYKKAKKLKKKGK